MTSGDDMKEKQPNNPLHGITLEKMLTDLVDHYGWNEMGGIINIRCFHNNPSMNSSLTFLRKTPWARCKVERLYLKYLRMVAKERKVAI
jgi:uncharacterized protein (DUF2132 family)